MAQMKKKITHFLLSVFALFTLGHVSVAQTKVDASELFPDENLNFGDGTVTKSGETISVNGSWKMYGWYNSSWGTTDLSDYSKMTVVISDYKGTTSGTSVTLFVNLFKSAEANDGENVCVTVPVGKGGDITVELDLETLCPYRTRSCYAAFWTWESCSFKVREFSFTRKATSALPEISGATVVRTVYVSLTGAESPTPTRGINFIRQTMSDGTVKCTKAIFK